MTMTDPTLTGSTPDSALSDAPAMPDAPVVSDESAMPDESTIPQDMASTSCEPTAKEMGVVDLTLDEGVVCRAYGKVYALDYTITQADYEIDLTIDNYNRRIKVLRFSGDIAGICQRLDYLARSNTFDKIFIKARAEEWQAFLAHGYMLEGIILHYFNGENAFVVSRFLTRDRISSATLIEESELIQALMARARAKKHLQLPSGYELALATEADIPGIAILYSHVFESYPSPLTMPDFLQSTMRRDVVYAVVKDPQGNVVSAASADIDARHQNAEMTDCATFPAERGKGLMAILLVHLEGEIKRRGITCAYTMARATAPAMNKVFYDLKYEYCGRLINNCDISGGFEDINIWSKLL